jgi:ferric-dicitrate binding protein FerR (iron transport regulator)
MDCPTRLELLEAVNGTADPSRVREHLAACGSCRAAYDGMMGATELLSRTSLAPAGPCVAEPDVAAYARGALPAAREAAVEEHLASCAACREEIAAVVELLDEAPAPARRPATRRFARPGVPPLAWAAAAAAALFFAVLLVLPARTSPAPGIARPKREEPKPLPEAPRPEPPRTETARPEPGVVPPRPSPPAPEEPKPVVRVDPPRTEAPVEPRKEEPRPAPPQPPPPKQEPTLAKAVPVRVLSVAGALSRRAAGGVERLSNPFRWERGEELFTDARRLGRFSAEGGVTGFLKAGTALVAEPQEGGELRVVLRSGAAHFAVEKRAQPFVVVTPFAEALVVGTAFQVQADEKGAVLGVSEGSVRFRNEKGEVLVKAGQRSVARAKERPSAPARWDAAGETAWVRRPDLSGDPKAEFWTEHAAGGNRKLAGLVVAAPYSEWETAGGRLAPLVAESLDAGLVLGHNHRNRLPKVHMNLDRGNELEVRDDGTRSAAAVATERSKAAFSDYLAQMRAAAGVGPKEPVPMVLCLRVHGEKHAGADLEVAEAAWTGWNRKTIEQLKVLYAQLLEKHKPAVRFDIKFEGVDATYELRGVKRNFMFTESDAESDGYMAPKNSTNAMAIFFPIAFSRSTEGYEAYVKILAEMAEFLFANRRK